MASRKVTNVVNYQGLPRDFATGFVKWQVASGSFNGVYLSIFCVSFFNHFSKLPKLPTDLSPYWSGGCLRYTYIHTFHSIPLHSIPFHSITLHYITIHTYIHVCTYTHANVHIQIHIHVHICMHAIFTLAGMFVCVLQCFVDAVFDCIWEGRVFRALMASKSLGTWSVPHWTLGLCMPRVLQSFDDHKVNQWRWYSDLAGSVFLLSSVACMPAFQQVSMRSLNLWTRWLALGRWKQQATALDFSVESFGAFGLN